MVAGLLLGLGAAFLRNAMRPGIKDPADIEQHNGLIISNNNNNPILVGKTVSQVERELIINTVDHCLGNRTHAANILGISIRTLRNKLKEYSDQSAISA